MPERSYRVLLWTLALCGLALDQSSKYGVFAWLADKPEHEFVVFRTDKGVGFQLVAQFERDEKTGEEVRDNGRRVPHVNQGALFGFGRGHKELANGGFAVISLLAAAAIIYWSTHRNTARDLAVLRPGADPGRHARQFLRSRRLQRRPRFPALELFVRLAGLQHRRLLPGVRRLLAAVAGVRHATGEGRAERGILDRCGFRAAVPLGEFERRQIERG
jgi:lipoprotein signal peptidase